MARKIREPIVNGKYKVGSIRGNPSIIHLGIDELFDFPRGVDGRANVLVYMNEERLDRRGDPFRYFAYSMHQYPHLKSDVVLATNPHKEYIQSADIIVGYSGDVNEYDDGSRVFVSPEMLEGIVQIRTLQNIVRDVHSKLKSKRAGKILESAA